MKKLVLAVLGGTAVASLAFASAATLPVDGGVLQAGVTQSLTCDPDGVKINWGLETNDSAVHSVNITGIHEDCEGADIVIRTNLMTRQQAGTIAGDSHRFHFATPQDAEALTSARVWIGR